MFAPLQLLIIDDAQKIFHCEQFWESLLKDTERKTRLLVAASYSFDTLDQSTPASFNFKFDYTDLRSEVEAAALVTSFAERRGPIFSCKELQTTVLQQVCGNVGLVRLTLEMLSTKFAKDDAQLASALQYLLSTKFLSSMDRCFSPPVNLFPAQRAVLEEAILAPITFALAPAQDENSEGDGDGAEPKRRRSSIHRAEAIKSLIHSCVLVQQQETQFLAFATPMHKRFYMSVLFPSSATGPSPSSINLFILNVVSAFPRKDVNSMFGKCPKTEFATEATWQALFYRCAAQLLPPHNSISAEVSRLATGGALGGNRRSFFGVVCTPRTRIPSGRFHVVLLHALGILTPHLN
jgi:hypothetical protein